MQPSGTEIHSPRADAKQALMAGEDSYQSQNDKDGEDSEKENVDNLSKNRV